MKFWEKKLGNHEKGNSVLVASPQQICVSNYSAGTDNTTEELPEDYVSC